MRCGSRFITRHTKIYYLGNFMYFACAIHRKGVFSLMQSRISLDLLLLLQISVDRNGNDPINWKLRNANEMKSISHCCYSLLEKKVRRYFYVRENLALVVRKYHFRSLIGKLIQFHSYEICEFGTINIHLVVVIHAIFVICLVKQMPSLKQPGYCTWCISTYQTPLQW